MEIHDDDQDRLMDMLLREELGGERPPQLSEKIRKRVAEERARFWRPRLSPGWIAVAVAAAMVAFVVVPRLLPSKPPETAQKDPPKQTPVKQPDENENPTEEPDEKPDQKALPPVPPIPPTPTVAEKIIRSENKEKFVELGGFCKVVLSPHTVLENKAESDTSKEQRVLLKEGSVACEVDSKKGKFVIENPLGSVRVTGTKFKVESVKREEQVRRLTVSVKEGNVFFDSPYGEMSIGEGQSGGCIVGVVTKTGKEFVELRADGEDQARRFAPRWVGDHGGGPDKRMMERIADLKPGTRIRMAWKFEEHERVIGFDRVPEEKKRDGDRREPAKRDGDREPRRDGERRDGEPRKDGDRVEPAKRTDERK